MTGIHVNWTAPSRIEDKLEYVQNNASSVKAKKLSRLYTALSALWWRRLNGRIELITDTFGLEEYKNSNLINIYDSYDTELLDSYDGNPKLWTAGKIYTLTVYPLPYVFLDNDLIIRSKLDESLFEKDLGFTHWEIPVGLDYVILDKSFDKYNLKSDLHLNFAQAITNTSFIYLNSKELQDTMHQEHLLNYKLESKDVNHYSWMLTDQFLPGNVLRNKGGSYFTIDSRYYIPNNTETQNNYRASTDPNFNVKERIGEVPTWALTEDTQKTGIDYEHVWFQKLYLMRDDSLYERTIERYSAEIEKEFPDYTYLI